MKQREDPPSLTNINLSGKGKEGGLLIFYCVNWVVEGRRKLLLSEHFSRSRSIGDNFSPPPPSLLFL